MTVLSCVNLAITQQAGSTGVPEESLGLSYWKGLKHVHVASVKLLLRSFPLQVGCFWTPVLQCLSMLELEFIALQMRN